MTFPDAYYYDDLTVFANHSTGDFLNVTYSVYFRVGVGIKYDIYITSMGVQKHLMYKKRSKSLEEI